MKCFLYLFIGGKLPLYLLVYKDYVPIQRLRALNPKICGQILIERKEIAGNITT
jgi:hypothetical protein